MRFNILGPLEITGDDGSPVPVSRPLHRCAIATLLLNAGHPCAATDLIAALWSEDQPATPEMSLRSCVYGVRKLLPDASRLRTHRSGYLLQVRPGELDLAEFHDLARRGREALDRGDPRTAATLLTAALGLWREPPLADVPVAIDRERLLDHRLAARDALTDARLALGQHRQVLAELRSSVAEQPLREHGWAQLITALYRSGARVEALTAFGQVRIALVRSYGIEPGPELQDLHRKVLADDPGLISGALPPGPAAGSRWRAPGQLPSSVADFTGREAELARLLCRLNGAGMAVTVLTGMLGTGKTALAVHGGHLARHHFPDGQLYACLDEDGRPRNPQQVLAELLRALGIRQDGLPPPGREREALYRSLLAGRRVLLLADGASSAAQVRPLLPGTAGAAVLVTSRARLADLEGARLIEVGVLPPAEAALMLARVSGRAAAESDSARSNSPGGPHDAGAEQASARQIAAACGHLPLALRIAGSRMAVSPEMRMADLAALLDDEDRVLAELEVGDASVRASISAAAELAGEGGRQALALMAATGAADGDGTAGQVIATLDDLGLLRRSSSGDSEGRRYLMHPLVRTFARQLLTDARQPAETRQVAVADC